MSKPSLTCGILLLLLGVGFFVATGAEHPTALIPAALGVLMGISARTGFSALGLAVGIIGFFGGLGMGAKTWMAEGPTNTAKEQLIMGVVCSIYLFLWLQSLRASRRAIAE